MKDEINVYAADTETTTIVMPDTEEAEVWLSGYCKLHTEDIKTFENLNGFFKAIMSETRMNNCDSLVYFHNLKFDGEFLLYYMETHGFKLVTECNIENHRRRKLKWKEYTPFIVDGQWFFIDVGIYCQDGYYRKIRFADSLKLLPSSLDNLTKAYKVKHQKLTGTIDYDRHNIRGAEITPEEMRYFENDIFGLKEVLEIVRNNGMDRLTIGSCALNYYKEQVRNNENPVLLNYGKNKGQAWQYAFPKLEDEIHDNIRKSYHGGWCYVNPKYKGQIVGKGYTLDVNSLYPSMMSSLSGNYYPVGIPEKWQGIQVYLLIEQLLDNGCIIINRGVNEEMVYCFFHIYIKFDLKENHFPCIQLKGDMRFPAAEWIERSRSYKNEISDEFIEMWVTQTDLALIYEQYNVREFLCREAYVFSCITGLFDCYVDYWYNIKKNSTDPILRSISKLYLNSLYGKFAQSTSSTQYIPYYDDETDMVMFNAENVPKKPLYMPVGSAITSYARAFTIRAATANFNKFCYADTDSLHIIGDVSEAKGVNIDSKEMCCWKHELSWNKAKFLRPKTYIELNDEHKEFKTCGLNDRGKKDLLNKHPEYTILDNFNLELEVNGGKTMRKRVKGGVILYDGDFNIRNSGRWYR